MQGALLPGWIGATVALLILIAFTYTQFRHIGLALAAALAPSPGYFAVMILSGAASPLCYLFGFVAAAILASGIESRICEGSPRADAVKDAVIGSGPAVTWPLLLAAGVVAIPSVVIGADTLSTALSVVLSGLSGLFLMMIAARFLPYSEDFIADANRLRESRERRLDYLTFVVQPRWGWSVSGIVLIFATLGYFGANNSYMPAAPGIVFPAAGIATAVIVYASTRNVRRSIAMILTAAVLICVMFWVRPYFPVMGADLLLAPALAMTPALILAARSSAFARAGDAVAVATLRGFEQLAAPVVFFCLTAATALCVLGAFGAAILIACGGVAALIVFPAVTTAIYDLFPPRVSLDAYRIR